jgi:prevent-host-death family protein
VNITTTELNRSPGKYVDVAEAGETVLITKRGKVVAMLVPGAVSEIVTPDITKPVVEKKASVTSSNVDATHVTGNFEATGEWYDDPPEDPGSAPVPSNPKPSAPVAPATVPEPVYRQPAGLSKSQQAGGKYDR